MHPFKFGRYHVGVSFDVQYINMSIQDLHEQFIAFNKCLNINF